MIAWLIVGGYVLGWLLASRFAYHAIRNDPLIGETGDDDGIDRAMNGAMAFIVGLFWPLALPVAVVMWRPPPTRGQIAAAEQAHDDEKRALERRIAELERELNLPRSAA